MCFSCSVCYQNQKFIDQSKGGTTCRSLVNSYLASVDKKSSRVQEFIMAVVTCSSRGRGRVKLQNTPPPLFLKNSVFSLGGGSRVA